MSRRALLLSLALLTAVVLWFLLGRGPAEESVLPAELPPATTLPPREELPEPALPEMSVLPPAPALAESSDYGGVTLPEVDGAVLVPFVVEDGYAIAFGDIILGVPEETGLKRGRAKLEKPGLWDPKEIPFVIDNDVPEPERVKAALAHITKLTGVKFVPYADQADAIHFRNGKKDCWAVFGRQGGLQPVLISPRCRWQEITHEVLHALGLIHEQSRFDRDRYVDILWKNIEKGFEDQFEMFPASFMAGLEDTAFDYESVMIYDADAFARTQGEVTMQSKTAAAIRPSENGLSAGDVQKVKKLFHLD